MKPHLFFLCFLLSLCGCKKQDPQIDYREFEILKTNFHGEYRLVSSTTDAPVDLDMDGTASTNLLSEIPALINSKINVKVIKNTYKKTGFDCYYVQTWLEQYLSKDLIPVKDIRHFDPAIEIDYLAQPISASLTIDFREKAFTLKNDSLSKDTRTLTLPEIVRYQGNQRAEGISSKVRKEFYTSSGIMSVMVTSLYQKNQG